MATLTTKIRKALPKNDFALPQDRKYPVDTSSRAINAKARATQQANAGNLSPAQKSTVDSKANAVLGKKTGMMGFMNKKKLA